MHYTYSLHGHAITVASSPVGKSACPAVCCQCAIPCPRPKSRETRQAWGTAYDGEAATHTWYCVPCPIPASAREVIALASVQICLNAAGECYVDQFCILDHQQNVLLNERGLQVMQDYSKSFASPPGIRGAFSMYLRVVYRKTASLHFYGSNITLLVNDQVATL